ncbi:uncharacterized protein LOC134805558 [Cydia splendana]|uniref:uncharacterized protein LOC134805558 n=1 Tax=Cydia splendana TaxID=1100963 RepID=UPI00300C060C
MALKRTPQNTPTGKDPLTENADVPALCGAGAELLPPLTTSYLQHTGSDSALDNIITRNKRKYVSEEASAMSSFMADMKKMFTEFSEKQDNKLTSIQKSVDGIREQYAEISKSIDFLSNKYDDMREELDKLKTERNETQKYIASLENRLEQQEKKSRSNEIEIRNVPKCTPSESKTDLHTTVQKICSTIGANIDVADIKDLHRINTKTEGNKPIMVEFTTSSKKECIMSAYKNFNKQHPTKQLNTKLANINEQENRIFISESLTFKSRKLFRQARDFAAENHFRFCWTARGVVYLRRDEGSPAHRITAETDFAAVKNATK